MQVFWLEVTREFPRISTFLSMCGFNKVNKEKVVGFFREQQQITSEGAESL